ncbi:Hypothetical predicted protein [Mytilus galloprovincialis]|uniref:Uncharacterized protein n=1 Tax=Mytilus galloprovincialis TaxID=29158 RepID=A0A8B6CVI1_MYTGA|nr:Hypothetical predicted protein [Mytilus galloprovincialis]
MTDVLDGPLGSMKKRSDPHVSELQAKLRERKKLGLTHDLSDSDVLEDNDDGDSEDDILNQYRIESSSHRRTDRPSSATRRSPVSTGAYDSGISLGDTLRPGQGNRFMKSQRKSDMPSIASPKQSPKDKQSLFADSMSYEQKEAIIMNRKTPTKDLQQRQSPVDTSKPWQPPSYRKVSATPEDDIGDSATSGLMRGRKTPQDPLLESISETPSPRYRKQSPNSDKKMPSMPGLDRKSPGLDRKSPGLDRKSPGLDRRSPGLDRKSPGLDRRSPGLDRKSPGLDRRSPSTDRKSPKALNLDDPLMSVKGASPRPKLKTDVFGSSSAMDATLDEEPTPKPRKSRFSSAGQKNQTESERLFGRKTPTESDRTTGRKTPTEKDRFGGRKTPTEKDRFTGRKTPTFGKKSEKEENEKTKEKSERKQEPSLMDFLTGDVTEKETQKKGKSKLFDDDDDSDEEEQRKQKVKPRRPRHEVQKEEEPEVDSFQALLAKKSYQKGRKPQADESSVCEEYEFEPGLKKTTELHMEQSQSLRSYNKQRSDKQQAEDAIDMVAGQQRTQQMKPIERPDSSKKTTTSSKIVKPKPRHSLPGTPTPSLTLSETDFNDTKSLREAIFNDWKTQRLNSARQKQSEEKKKKDEEEKKKKQDLINKKLENEAAYKTWKEQREPVIKDKMKEKHREEKKKKLEEEEKLKKKKDAEKEFKKWKELNDEKLVEQQKEKKRAERRKEEEEKRKQRERVKDNESALRVWKEKKEDVIKEKTKEEKDKMKQTKRYMDEEKRRQEEEARQKYEKWLSRKVCPSMIYVISHAKTKRVLYT